MPQLEGNVFVTGGAGYLARALYARARREDWRCRWTAYSRDSHKHASLLRDFPEVRCICGDVSDNPDQLALAMVGHDIVIHAAAEKHVDLSEVNVFETIQTNTFGSMNVAQAAVTARVRKCIAISTDKACRPITLYGLTKRAMERVFQEAATWQSDTGFHLVRYGNVLSSTGSVLPVWKAMLAKDGFVTATRPDMTRFWLTPDQAIDLILDALTIGPGNVLIPKAPALSMADFARYILPDAEFRYKGLRSIEKLHEDLLAPEERPYALESDNHYLLGPMIGPGQDVERVGYSSDNPAHWLTQAELLEMLTE